MVIGSIKHSILVSFPSLFDLPISLPVFSGVISLIDYLLSNPRSGSASGTDPNQNKGRARGRISTKENGQKHLSRMAASAALQDTAADLGPRTFRGCTVFAGLTPDAKSHTRVSDGLKG